MNFSARTCFFFGFLACASMLAIAAYFQFFENLEPCPLCISQRMIVFLVGITMLAAAIQNPGKTGIRVYSVLALLFSMFGASVSGRHVWLQHLPPEQVPECGPGIEYVFKHFPLTKTLELLLSGTGECAKVDWTFLGLSIPGWTLVGFVLLALLGGAQYRNVSP
ncbi:MAG: disulfide bond formation protein B [Methylococcaceae bacterium]|nr:disulfide bond formation protein B [Methylococcaceae bacterium]MCI0732445.1 disulfide bond formation protein B [Methylococcaceae bacterium]